MSQHDNGRRPGGTQSGAWQQGQRDQHDPSNAQQAQASSSGRYGSQYGGGQQGGHVDQGGSRGHQDQYDHGRGQQGDNWREQPGSSGGYRPGMEERSRGGQGSFGGQASDNDYGNRGITESGNFGNYGSQRDNYGAMSNQGRGSYDQGGQSGQRFGSAYRHGYDARSDSTGGYGSGNYGADQNFGSGNYGGGDFNAGSYSSRASGDWNRDRARNDADRQRGFNDQGPTWGQSSADNYQGSRGWQGSPGNQDRYGDNGYQGNFQQGQRGQSYHDPDYHQWRSEQVNRLDRDYDEWRQHRYQRFSDDFDNWRSNRDNDPNRASRAGSQSGSGNLSDTGGNNGLAGANDTQANASKPDTSHGDKSKSSDASRK